MSRFIVNKGFGVTFALLCLAGEPSFAQKKQGAAKKPAVDVPAEPTPRWPDGTVNLGSVPGQKGFWEVRAGGGGFPTPKDAPMQPWARAVYNYREATFAKESPLQDCKAASGPAFLGPPGFEIVDVPELKSIFILDISGPHSWRVIYMDGRPHPKGDDLRPTYLGHSVGHWEGDTLVVDSVGFNEKFWLIRSYPTTDQLHLTERISRPNLRSLTYEVTVDDPGAYTKPWSATWNITPASNTKWTPGEMFEYICEDSR